MPRKRSDRSSLTIKSSMAPIGRRPFTSRYPKETTCRRLFSWPAQRRLLIAGQIALARQLPILAVDKYDGSGAKIRGQITPTDYSWTAKPINYFVKNLKAKCIAVADSQNQARRDRELLAALASRTRHIRFGAGAFAALLITLVVDVGFTLPPQLYAVIIFAGFISAGATGALVRTMLWDSPDSDPRMSIFLGAVAGIVVALAYLLPQLMGAPAVVAPNAVMVTAINKIQFISAVLVAFSAGVGFDTVFKRIRTQTTKLPIGSRQGI